MKFKVDQKIFAKWPEVRIGVLVILGMDNTKNGDKVLALLREEEKKQNQILQTVDFGALPETAEWRQVYEQFSSKPRDFRSSVESLLRRVRTNNPLPSINPLVDLYNYLSIKHYLPAGAEDLDKVVGDIELTFATGEEKGKYIGAETEENCYPGEVIYKDDQGFICRRWNWREGDRTKIEATTRNAVLVQEALPAVSEEKFNQALSEAKSLVENFLSGSTIVKILRENALELEWEKK